MIVQAIHRTTAIAGKAGVRGRMAFLRRCLTANEPRPAGAVSRSLLAALRRQHPDPVERFGARPERCEIRPQAEPIRSRGERAIVLRGDAP